MTPKEKAKELLGRFKPFIHIKMGYDPEYVKKNLKGCALVVVDEIIDFVDEQMQGFLDADWINYWVDVKQEIEKL